MSDKKYWQSFGALNHADEFSKLTEDEFREELPFEDIDGKGWLDAKAPRRDFLKYLGFSTAAATLAAGCEIPVQKVIPYANKPENLIPGVAKYYATTYVQNGDVVPIVAKVRDGRPIKIEGNDLCGFTQGGTSARVQASVLDLYDTFRLTHPKHKVNDKWEEVPTYEQLDKMIGDALGSVANSGQNKVVLLTSTISSPSTKQIITEFLSRYPGSKHVQYDADSYSGMLQANQESFGQRAIPSYHFDKAEVIVSLGADFLGTWLSPVEFARGYSKGRKIDEKNPVMSKHIQFESSLSMTGASADERYTHRPSETGAVALALYAALGGGVAAPAIENQKTKAAIQAVANKLKAASGKALVVCGSNDPNVQLVVNAINASVGAYGSSINWASPMQTRMGLDSEMATLTQELKSGSVGAILIWGANPAYDYLYAEDFKAGMAKTKLSVSFNQKLDETTELCQYVVPDHHFLESWGDAEPKAGYISFLQPTIFPLFKTRPFQTSLLKWSGNTTAEYDTYFKEYWNNRLGSNSLLESSLQAGVVDNTNGAVSAGSFAGDVAGAASRIAAYKKVSGDEIVLYQKVSIGTGAQAGNPWLQELPDPITRATWDNYAMISTSKATELGIDYKGVDYEYYPQKQQIKISVNGKEAVELPILVVPGMDEHTIAVAVGYGRSENIGKAAAGVGKNVYPFALASNGAILMNNAVTIEKSALSPYKIAQTQIHGSYEGRTEVVKETTLATFKKYPHQFKEFRDELKEDFAANTGDYRAEATIYPNPDDFQPGMKWGMSIDMNSCTACHACVVACHAENNVPVVGKSEVLRYHDMHWLRIDRYFVSKEENPEELDTVIFQPMLCQHCDNAPCENVCPVAATNHSSEGLNQMTYNRCIGTRYCANNCPYKVRRFNWADYTGADSFKNNQDQSTVGKLDPVVHQMNDDLTRMVLNPDVTVRSRGVIEKCSFCVQRLQEGKLNAKKEQRPVKDGEIKTACMQACPTDAIVFGNVHDKSSRIHGMRENNQNRLFYVIEQIHTLPNVSYLAKIRNTDEIIEPESAEPHAGTESGGGVDEHNKGLDNVHPAAVEEEKAH